MSASLETVMRGIDAFNRRDVDLIAELTTPDFAWFPALPGAFAADGYRGRKGVETYLGEIESTWKELRLVVEELRELGDTVLFLGRAEARGRSSGAAVDAAVAIVYQFRGEKISCSRAYLDPGEALRAAGLSQ
jgi:ketosteroid isomerase-like protein